MRTSLCVIAALGSVLAAAAASGLGCGALPADCPDRYRCPDTATTGTGGSTTTGTGAGGTGGGGGSPTSCVPGEKDDPVADDCGIFVSSSKGKDTPGQGAPDKPFKTLAFALKAAVAAKKPLYACAETFTEELTVAAGVTVYGGLDCNAKWVYAAPAKKTTLTAGADKVPLTLSAGAQGATIHDLLIKAVDAQSQGLGAGSSIAVIANQAKASFVRCDLLAGNGMSGLPGDTPKHDNWPKNHNDFGIVGNSGLNTSCISAVSTPGGTAKLNSYCLAAGVGGAGGIGSINTGGDGEAKPANQQTAGGGDGQKAADVTLDCMIGQGKLGASGAAGPAGADAKGLASLGAISALGYMGIDGKTGKDGSPGQGGGGGGGAKGKPGPPICFGASGGSGGAGGCPGQGGLGGRFGGSSFGLLNLDATLTFTSVTIKVGQGGSGGDGGEGEFGDNGGTGGTAGDGVGASSACSGGNGGSGGPGGRGGGARGGHAIGIGYTMAKPDVSGVSFTPGTPGLGGMGADAASYGDDGIGADLQAF